MNKKKNKPPKERPNYTKPPKRDPQDGKTKPPEKPKNPPKKD